MTYKEFEEFIVERDGSHKITFESIMFQYQSANTLTENSVTIDVLKKVMDRYYARKRKIQKNTKTSD